MAITCAAGCRKWRTSRITRFTGHGRNRAETPSPGPPLSSISAHRAKLRSTLTPTCGGVLNPRRMELRYSTLDVFTDRPFGGNPLAVFCDQPELPDERMQTIAREFNLSETVFIVPPRDARALRRLRIFTPAHELPFAGHPTIGAVHALVEAGIAKIGDEGDEFALELEVGLVPIHVQR